MLPEEIITQLSQSPEEVSPEMFTALEDYTPIDAEEAQLLVDLLVPFLKNEVTRNKAYQVFRNYQAKFSGTKYPKELLDSNLLLKNTFSKLKDACPPIRKGQGHSSSPRSLPKVAFLVLVGFSILMLFFKSELLSTAEKKTTFSTAQKIVESSSPNPQSLLEAASSGDGNAQYELGEMYFQGKEIPRDDEKAFHWIKTGAEQGNASCQFRLGYMYDMGECTKQDKKKGIFYYSQAAKNGDSRAQVILGCAYAYGLGVNQDTFKAFVWLTIASNQGVENASAALISVKARFTPEQLKYAQDCASDWSPGQLPFPEVDEVSVPETIADPEPILPLEYTDQGFKRLRIALESGDPRAMKTPVDVTKIKEFAKSGSNEAQMLLNALFQKIFSQSTETKIADGRDAGEENNPSIDYENDKKLPDDINKDGLAFSGNGLHERAFTCFYRAAMLDHPGAQYNAGKSLWGGIGCDINKPKAIAWLCIAGVNTESAAHREQGAKRYVSIGMAKTIVEEVKAFLKEMTFEEKKFVELELKQLNQHFNKKYDDLLRNCGYK